MRGARRLLAKKTAREFTLGVQGVLRVHTGVAASSFRAATHHTACGVSRLHPVRCASTLDRDPKELAYVADVRLRCRGDELRLADHGGM